MTDVWLDARGSSLPDAPDAEDWFAGRWDVRRPFHDEVRPLLVAIGRIITAFRAEGEPGGLVVGVDRVGTAPARRLRDALVAPEPGPLSPADFLFSLPSTAAATVGVAAGFLAYQATISGEGLAGFAAVNHARELIATGRLDRVVVGALTIADGLAMAEAWQLTSRPTPVRLTANPADTLAETGDLLADLPASHRALAAPSLLAAGRWIDAQDGPASVTLRHAAPELGASAELTLDIPAS